MLFDFNARFIKISPIWQTLSPGICLGYELIAGRIWIGDILIADLEDFEKLDASEIYPRRINAKEILIRQKDDEFTFSVADGTAKLSGRDCEFREMHSKAGQLQGARISAENFMVNRESLNRQKPQMTLKPVPTSGRFKVTSSVVITMNLGLNSTCPRKEHSPTPLKYTDVTRSTPTDLDVLQEKRIDDYWIVDSSRHLSMSRKSVTKFTLLSETPLRKDF